MSARFNVSQLLVDAELTAANVYDLGQESAGSLRFRVFYGDETVDLWMPDIPLSQIRFLRGDRAPATDGAMPPRVQIDGSSWTWPVAIDVLSRHLLARAGADGNETKERSRRSAQWASIVAQLELSGLGDGEIS